MKAKYSQRYIGVFLKWNRNSVISANSANLNHEFELVKDLVCHIYLACAMVATLCLTQEVAVSSPITVMAIYFQGKLNRSAILPDSLKMLSCSTEKHWVFYLNKFR